MLAILKIKTQLTKICEINPKQCLVGNLEQSVYLTGKKDTEINHSCFLSRKLNRTPSLVQKKKY